MIFLVSGKAGSGKSTFAELLADQLDNSLIINYADLVKYIAKTYYNWNGEKDESGRALLQEIGTERGRKHVNEDIWITMTANIISILSNKYNNFIIADCRFPNEIDYRYSKKYDVYSIRIERPNYKNNLTEQQNLHESETALDDYNFDYIVENSGTLDDLHDTAIAILEDIH